MPQMQAEPRGMHDWQLDVCFILQVPTGAKMQFWSTFFHLAYQQPQ
jgi:hypothetical protein